MMSNRKKNRRWVAFTVLIFLVIFILKLPSVTLLYPTNLRDIRVDTNNNNTRQERVAPSPITGLKLENVGDGESVNLTWNACIDPSFDHYNIYQNTTDFTDVTDMKPINSSITDNSTTHYIATGLTCNVTYYFAVTAVNSFEEEDKSVKSENITVKELTLYIVYPTLYETVSGNITVQVKVINESVANLRYVNISINKGPVLQCTYNGISRNYEHFWDTLVETDGSHTIDAYATNKYNVTRSANQILVTVSNQHFTLQFSFGWNSITLPLNTNYKYAGDLANAIPNCTHIGQWNTSTQQFDMYVKNTGINNFTLQCGIGYMVYTNTTSSLTLTGTNITTATINLNAGWNSAGRFNSTATTAENLGQNITNCTAVAYWNVTLMRFITHPINTDICNFSVERGGGYFVYVTKESVWINQ